MPDTQHKRAHRVGQLIQEELGKLFAQGLRDPRVGFVTVTDVRLSDDLRSAHVFVSVFGEPKGRQESLVGLGKAAGFLQRELAHRLKLRHTPHLRFELDDSLDYAQRVDDLLHAVARGEHEAPDPAALSPLPKVDIDRAAVPSVEPPPLARTTQRKYSRTVRGAGRRNSGSK